jgi:hypothetical protein
MSKSSERLADLIKKHQEVYDYCEHVYLDVWKAICGQDYGAFSQQKKESTRREAQRDAIDKAFVSCLVKYADNPDITEDLSWSLISAAYKYNLAHLQDFGLTREQAMEAYDRCISAHQSWNKASGHSFERYLSKISTPEMKKYEIEFLLKKDILRKIKNHELVNSPEDLDHIREWAENFDLYAVQTNHNEMHIFGCIQTKTSIRDRVGRDDHFSTLAMDANFWVAEAVLNGSFFNLPKYYAMVNGGSVTYPTNNWHGVYAMAGIETEGRIYKDDDSFSLMGDHAVQAALLFSVNRKEITRDWKAKDRT